MLFSHSATADDMMVHENHNISTEEMASQLVNTIRKSGRRERRPIRPHLAADKRVFGIAGRSRSAADPGPQVSPVALRAICCIHAWSGCRIIPAKLTRPLSN
jgi:hypothetical protein